MQKVFFLLTLICINLFAVDASMEIIKKSDNLPKIEISAASDTANIEYVNKIKKLLIQDLLVSGHFEAMSSNEKISFSSNPNMLGLKNKGIDLFLNISIKESSFGGLNLNIKLFDNNLMQLILEKTISSSQLDRYPFVAHRAAIIINKHLNAPSIDWMDKFVIFSVYKDAKEANIVIGDYTLTFQKTIIKGGLNIFPKWANDKQDSFYYTSYRGSSPQLIKYNLYTRKVDYIMKSQGMIVCSDVNKDGSKLLITASPEGQPDIYLYDTKNKRKERLTNYKGIDVGAHFAENDTKIVFVSDRLNHPNIFSKKINGRGVERLVYHGKNNSSATTFDSYVVYSSRETQNEFTDNTFNLYLISLKSDFIRRLTTNGVNQFPKFSNDGESVLFIKNYQNRSNVGIIRLNYNKSFLFPLTSGKLQSIDW
ncbi:TolB domain protein [Arcobacter nitrofigilis DSM 7299]|uniref:TolB domain protein n=1 Tax=Arcobacter nitrofigilis (strain ATCC 33309 / DSM 7299 / CCUG 15893 / LMG 7604 / NCTC 12251 / CI) TaxID=572480 RepID=D5V126_ARCNC|nr:Tol-Pal system protein TolB [Arcobacter nitrofigilis]ADG93988.1 TolB domain protein [Arcobacter nitrofigilis DSM 7299]